MVFQTGLPNISIFVVITDYNCILSFSSVNIDIQTNALLMKKILIILIVQGILWSCSSNEESSENITPISTDISVSAASGKINWADKSDLMQKLESTLVYNYGAALESEIEKAITITNDSTLASASINFKIAFQSVYTDPNSNNNSVTVLLEKEVVAVNATVLKADGPGGTYALITSVLAPGNNPIETPDCNHAEFGDHIDEVFDNALNANVFRFNIHTTPDNDRCINFDRQRNEIKTYDQSPDNLLGTENEKVTYKWKFKLAAGFQSSPNFTHLHQLKSVGGSLESMPMYTFTTRKGTPDTFELRYAETDNQVTLAQTEIAPLLDTWLDVTETITYGTSGTYELVIKKVSDGTVLFSYSNSSIVNWRPGAAFVRPKWGIYRSLKNAQDLRDETLLFADFSIAEID